MAMKRREFLTRTAIMGAAGMLAPGAKLYGAVEGGYTGELFVALQADGGWDVSSYCDPKVNQPGELEITHWSRDLEVQQAGNIPFAPFSNNATMFNKYYRDMLVINGVDAQTNSHSTGVIHNWSGRNSVGYPTLSALFAAKNAPEQPLSYINFGGFAQTGNLIRFSRLDDINTLQQLLVPENNWDATATFRRSEDMSRIRAARSARLARLMQDPNLIPRQKLNMEAYESALNSKAPLSEFNSFLPSESEIIPDLEIPNVTWSSLKRQIQMTAAAFEAGLASAVDLHMNGYDTHTTHDARHEQLFTHFNESIDLLWTLAEEKGFADRMTVVIASDFSRTPWYNADNGKDHWPIGSVIVMRKNASWTNRAVGLTDEGQNAYALDPTTLERDDANGVIILPKHVHLAVRKLIGVDNTTVDKDFQFGGTESFRFFG